MLCVQTRLSLSRPAQRAHVSWIRCSLFHSALPRLHQRDPPPQQPIRIRQRTRRGGSTHWTTLESPVPSRTTDPAGPAGPGTVRDASRWVIVDHVESFETLAQQPAAASASAPTPISNPMLTRLFKLPGFGPVWDKLSVIFLPRAYTHTTYPEYLPYTFWQLVHNVSGTVTGTLSTQALLHALGMGAAASYGLAATTNWIIKDGFGMLGGVLYAGLIGNRFDSHPKRYRFLSAIAIQAATFAELLTPLFPQFFLPMASFSNVGKNIGWLAASATKASMHKGFGKEDNLGDITAKCGVQSTAAGLIGTGVGVGLSWTLGTEPMTLMLAFVPLSALNIWSTIKSNQWVITRTLNVERGELFMSEVFVAGDLPKSVSPDATGDRVDHALSLAVVGLDPAFVPSPESISSKEHFMDSYASCFVAPLLIEPPMAPYVESFGPAESAFIFGTSWAKADEKRGDARLPQSQPKYRTMIVPGPIDPAKDAATPGVALWFLEDATGADTIKGFFHACIIRKMLEGVPRSSWETAAASGSLEELRMGIITRAHEVLESRFDDIRDAMKQKGWVIEKSHLADVNSRICID
ncbi:vitamin B6 photo-protection and homoeostasis-domain-containing protein [Polychytrium aggregatum]|uniref:vitamin B6 photo-protection and homoeostasis-domain-containing protein n=1 Tax=Polychytrium aggregatum TaxID=110093 RepID=UPI0022FF0A31|nr:vitamin B6 photo-protection and homoeostasis-domain-containing protein [Polychytrium aggregatum]KAI9209249.1 vitamin B6 photo-protection and homoeostasis-domain-containing protein [Polychytrium aggregatum]